MKCVTHLPGRPATSLFSFLPVLPAQLLCCLLCPLLLLTACRKHDFNPPPVGAYDLRLVADGLTSPLVLTESPDGSNRLFIADQTGKIWIMKKDGALMPNPFIDISSLMVSLSPFYDERGLLGFAFHPQYKTNGKFYLFYTAPPRAGGPDPGSSWNNLTRISEFKVSASNPNAADMASERVVFEADHPQMNHDGGTIAFGPDGYLYISIGDGGGAGDVGAGHADDWYPVNAGGNGQDITQNLQGDILRIDVDNWGKMGYSIPPDNPFVGTEGLDEIYAYGFRNPYRFSFDMGGSHQLYVGDAGQNLYEEIDIVTKGGNYGWNVKEGTHCFNTDDNMIERPACPMTDTAGNPLLDPIIELPNYENPHGGIATAIVGGHVYRGKSIPFLYGKYIFGILSADEDEPEGKLLMGKPSAGGGLWGWEFLHLKSFPDNLEQYVKSFGQDLDGEVYVMTSGEIGPQGNTGKVYKLVITKKD